MFKEGIKKAKDIARPSPQSARSSTSHRARKRSHRRAPPAGQPILLSLARGPARRSVRPTIGLAYLFARASDTIADTRALARARAHRPPRSAARRARRSPPASRIAALVDATAALAGRSPPSARSSSGCPTFLAAYRALAAGRPARVCTGARHDRRGADPRTCASSRGRTKASSPRSRRARTSTATPTWWRAAWVSSGPRCTWPIAPASPAGTCPAPCARSAPASARACSSPTCCATCRATCATGRRYLPRAGPGPPGPRAARSAGSGRRGCRAPAPARVARHRARSLRRRVASTPSRSRGAEARMRLACAWPLLIGLSHPRLARRARPTGSIPPSPSRFPACASTG